MHQVTEEVLGNNIYGRMVKWQTRQFKVLVPKGVGVQIPLRPPI
jgi:hypothetical protein